MKERPILFSTEMVKAILEGRKTQTRRIMKPQPFPDKESGYTYFDKKLLFDIHTWRDEITCACRFKKGMILWVRETFLIERSWHKDYYEYKADYSETMANEVCWEPSIFMPRKAARIFLEVIDVRVERLNDITKPDIIEEGIDVPLNSTGIGSYAQLWEKINGEGSWDENPWVWVITFKSLKP